jgi:hypothetical protein
LKGFLDCDEGVMGDRCMLEFFVGCASDVDRGVIYPKVQKRMHCPRTLASSEESKDTVKLFLSFCFCDVLDECGIIKP